MKQNLEYWIALNFILSDSYKLTKKIVDFFPSVEDIFKASRNQLISLGLETKAAEKLKSSRILDESRREIERCNRLNYSILTLDDENYPDYLREIYDPPFVLYCAGNREVLNKPSVSIVGARKPTPYGRAAADKLARELSSRGLVIVSGLASGLDSVAHWGALKEGKTTAVLGSGLDNIYPKENRGLFKKIIDEGAVITEFPKKSPPLGYHFPMRNRIISGLSIATVVVEASNRSGSLISARLALEQNREVMAVPGNINSKLSEGTNWLIKTGAKTVTCWEDVAEEFPLPLREKLLQKKTDTKRSLPSLTSREKSVFEILKTDIQFHIDEIVNETKLSVSKVLSVLMTLEIKGLVVQRPGKYYLRRW